MAFTSIAFMVFAPLFFTTYYLIPDKYRPHLVGVSSLIFYAYWEVKYVPLIIVSAFIDYFCSLKIHNSQELSIRRRWLILALTLNLGILFFFKYWNFFVENVEGLTGFEITMINVILPLGISFYTLQTLSYTFDTYRGKLTPERNFGTYFIYVTYFPQLVAGPIERASSLMPQLRSLGMPTTDDLHRGLMLIAWGFFAKLVVADNLAGFVSHSYFKSDGGLLLWPISYLAVAQVYCDFFGYTLIARGLAWCMGVKLSLNFRQPLLAKNMTSFWQRWHITLTKWVTDYIHIPLARRYPLEPMRSILAIMAMCLIGLWHGASWNFVLFGLANGIIMRVWAPIGDLLMVFKPGPRVQEVFSRTALFFSVCFVAPFFFIRDSSLLFSQLSSMFSTNLGWQIIATGSHRIELVIGVAMLGVFLLNDGLIYKNSRYHVEELAKHPLARTVLLTTIITAILLLGNFKAEGFIYFEF